MAQINEKLVTDVFDSMVKHKPSLAKYLITDEDEPTSSIDKRLLADQIIRNFPWPIGVELRRLFSGSMRQLDRGRLDQLFKTIERTVQFFSFVLLGQMLEDIMKKKFEVPKEFSQQFKDRICVMSLGNYTWLIRSIGNIFTKFGVEPFMAEMKETLNNKFYQTLDFWVPERNEIGHYQINLTDEEIQKRCVEYEEKLTLILQNLSFIIKYKLVTIREIKVLKYKHKEAKYSHLIDMLNSSDSDFKATEIQNDIFSDSNAILLMKDFKNPTEFLNLSPWVIDTRPEIIDTKEKFNLKKDIFMYTKFQNEKLLYIGTEITEKCDLTVLGNYQMLVEQFREMLRFLSPTEIAVQV